MNIFQGNANWLVSLKLSIHNESFRLVFCVWCCTCNDLLTLELVVGIARDWFVLFPVWCWWMVINLFVGLEYRYKNTDTTVYTYYLLHITTVYTTVYTLKYSVWARRCCATSLEWVCPHAVDCIVDCIFMYLGASVGLSFSRGSEVYSRFVGSVTLCEVGWFFTPMYICV